jgi:uncharacterized damage-inducible protein DinB
MLNASQEDLFPALEDSWLRNNRMLVNLLRAVPAELLDHRMLQDGFSIAGMFVHMDFCRRYLVKKNAPESAVPELPDGWRDQRDPERIELLLEESAKLVPQAVAGRLASGRAMEVHYDHPILLIQQLIWHEGYHHGQIKAALKLAGRPLNDDDGSLVTFDIWMDKTS